MMAKTEVKSQAHPDTIEPTLESGSGI